MVRLHIHGSDTDTTKILDRGGQYPRFQQNSQLDKIRTMLMDGRDTDAMWM